MSVVRVKSSLATIVAKQSTRRLLLWWLAAYVFTGLIFSGMFFANIHALKNACDFYDVIHFSFSTLATVGYGDIVPLSWNRLFAGIESFIGLGLNGTFIGLIVVIALRRPVPIVFPKYLVFDVEKTTFWFRSLNVVDVNLINPVFNAGLTIPIWNTADTRNRYDILGGSLWLPYKTIPRWPPMHLVATRTANLAGEDVGPSGMSANPPVLGQLVQELEVSPLHLRSSYNKEGSQPKLTLSISGSFEDTGTSFSVEVTYRLDQIRCGKYVDIENAKYESLSIPEKSVLIAEDFEDIRSTSENFCVSRCPLHAECPLDVAVRTRNRLAVRNNGVI